MARILVLGAGVMGTAITVPLIDNGHDVRLVGTHLDADIIESIHESSQHPGLRSRVPEEVKPFMIQQLGEAYEDVDLVVLGVNSLGVRWAAEVLSDVLEASTPILSLTKGLDGDGERLLLLPEVFHACLPGTIRDAVKIAAVGGPSIAGELAARHQTSVVFTGDSMKHLHWLKDLFETEYYRIQLSTDFVGVEVSVGLKNLCALGLGIVKGLADAHPEVADRDAMHNLEAALFTRSLLEMAYLAEWMGGSRATVYGLPGVGDLYVTCQGGRNSRIGRYIGMGMSYEEARERYMPGETIEGAELAFSIDTTVQRLSQIGRLDAAKIRLLTILIRVIKGEASAGSVFDLVRTQVHELR